MSPTKVSVIAVSTRVVLCSSFSLPHFKHITTSAILKVQSHMYSAKSHLKIVTGPIQSPDSKIRERHTHTHTQKLFQFNLGPSHDRINERKSERLSEGKRRRRRENLRASHLRNTQKSSIVCYGRRAKRLGLDSFFFANRLRLPFG